MVISTLVAYAGVFMPETNSMQGGVDRHTTDVSLRGKVYCELSLIDYFLCVLIESRRGADGRNINSEQPSHQALHAEIYNNPPNDDVRS